jgi:hypothetical protein
MSKKKICDRLICMACVAVMASSLLPVAASAEEINSPSSEEKSDHEIPMGISEGKDRLVPATGYGAEESSLDYNDVVEGLRSADDNHQIVTEAITDGGVTAYVYGDRSKFLQYAKEHSDIGIEIVSAPYSYEQLSSAVGSIENLGDTINSIIAGVAIKNDGTGLRVDVDQAQAANAYRRGTATYENEIRSNVGVPVTFSYAEKVKPTSRWTAESPFASGAVMASDIWGSGGVRCSTGFWGRNFNTGKDVMITADHCGIKTGITWHAGSSSSGSLLGTGVAQRYYGSDDINAFVKDTSATVAPAVYWGSFSTDQVTPIYGFTGYPSVNQSVCYSGSYSGTVCGNTVTDVHYYVNYGSQGDYAEQICTKQSSSVPAVGNGDSGGPVLQVIDGKAYAQGVISGMRNAGNSCTGLPGQEGGRQCSAVVFYAAVEPYVIEMNTGIYSYAG